MWLCKMLAPCWRSRVVQPQKDISTQQFYQHRIQLHVRMEKENRFVPQGKLNTT